MHIFPPSQSYRKGRFIICLNANIHSVHLPYRVKLELRKLVKNAVPSIFCPDLNMYSVCQTHSKDFKLWKIKDFSVILYLKIHSAIHGLQVYDVYNIH